MNKIKINIMYNFHKGPWGGGNQFLKALKREFQKSGIYESNPSKADCIIFNSHHNFNEVIKFKIKKQSKIFIHRVDGPISNYRKDDYDIDKIIYTFNYFLADGTIFQSNWSRQANYKLGMKKNTYETIIMNAVDPQIFNEKNKMIFDDAKKIQLIANSWDPRWKKGFQIYKYLDENLDFSKYEMTFIGQSPIKFKNIKWIKPLPSLELAKQLKFHNIFISASREEACSNSLIEALQCGLPAVVPKGGSNPKILGNAGELFEGKKDVIEKIEMVAQNYRQYQKRINVQMIHAIAEKYQAFCSDIFKDYINNNYIPKRSDYFLLFKLRYFLFKQKIRRLGIFEYIMQIVLNNFKNIIDLLKK